MIIFHVLSVERKGKKFRESNMFIMYITYTINICYHEIYRFYGIYYINILLSMFNIILINLTT